MNLLFAALFSLMPTCPQGETLDARLTSLVRTHKGKVAIAVKHLGTGESFYLNADEVMPSASLIKLPILIEAYLQVIEGKIKLTETLTLREVDKVPGSGILTENFSAGATFAFRDALRLMTVFSDNTATNLVLDRIGIKAVNERMSAWGLKETRLNAKVYCGATTSVDPERTRKYGLGSTTAREMVLLLDTVMTSQRIKPAPKQAILGMLQKCNDREKFTRFLPAEVVIAHKTGSVASARTAAGLIYLDDGPVALCVLTADNEDQSWSADNAGNLLCAKAAREVYTYFTKRTSKR
jgi:beta-lactamase class A